jgi:glycosyltransferase involved in cell wall biosynthesis
MNISAIIPIFNRANLLPEAVASACAQTLPCAELILVDDASTDDSVAVARHLAQRAPIPVRILEHSVNRGIGAARNTGIRAAVHPWVAFLDSDDLWAPEKNARQAAALAAAPGTGVSTSGFEEFFCPTYTPQPGEQLRADAGILGGTMICVASTFERVGLFDAELRAGEFIEWMARVRAARIPAAHVSERLLRRRVHGTNTARGTTTHSHYLRAVRMAMEHARRSAAP